MSSHMSPALCLPFLYSKSEITTWGKDARFWPCKPWKSTCTLRFCTSLTCLRRWLLSVRLETNVTTKKEWCGPLSQQYTWIAQIIHTGEYTVLSSDICTGISLFGHQGTSAGKPRCSPTAHSHMEFFMWIWDTFRTTSWEIFLGQHVEIVFDTAGDRCFLPLKYGSFTRVELSKIIIIK